MVKFKFPSGGLKIPLCMIAISLHPSSALQLFFNFNFFFFKSPFSDHKNETHPMSVVLNIKPSSQKAENVTQEEQRSSCSTEEVTDSFIVGAAFTHCPAAKDLDLDLDLDLVHPRR